MIPCLITLFMVVSSAVAQEGLLYDTYPSFWNFLWAEKGKLHYSWLSAAWVAFVLAVCAFLYFQKERIKHTGPEELLLFAMAILYIVPGANPMTGLCVVMLFMVCAINNRRLLLPAALFMLMHCYLYTAKIYSEELLPCSLSMLSWLYVGIMLWTGRTVCNRDR